MDIRLRTAYPPQNGEVTQNRLENLAGDKESILNSKCFNEKIPICPSDDSSQTECAQHLSSNDQNWPPHSKSNSYFETSNENFWDGPVKFFQILVRELSVLLILIETLILLGGYLMILGVHHSLRYLLSKLRHKSQSHEQESYDAPVRYNYQHYNAIPDVVPRRVPRGRMAGG